MHGAPHIVSPAAHARSRAGFALCAGAAILVATFPAYAADHAAAERALNEGKLDQAVTLLRAQTAADARDAAAQLLLCRAYYAAEEADPAIHACEAALAANADSATQDWMGRAYGLKADHAGPFSGMSLAKKVKASFEAAVAANSKNAAAVDDLSEYYIGAPGIVGGGTDKALTLAQKVEATLPQSAHRIRALVAAKTGDTATAEREYRAAIAVANAPAAWVDLGQFFSKHKQFDQAVTALHKAVELDTAHDSSLADAAMILNSMHREPVVATRWLTDYLASSARTDAVPAPRAHVELAKIAARAGDKARAQAELDAALALAARYAPAKKEIQAL